MRRMLLPCILQPRQCCISGVRHSGTAMHLPPTPIPTSASHALHPTMTACNGIRTATASMYSYHAGIPNRHDLHVQRTASQYESIYYLPPSTPSSGKPSTSVFDHKL